MYLKALSVLSLLCLLALTNVGCAAAPAARDAPRIRLSPNPPPRGEEPGRLAVRIQPLWMDEGFFSLRLPETFHADNNLYFIDHSRPDMIPVEKLQEFPTWSTDESGTVSYRAVLPSKIEFSGKLTPGPDYVDASMTAFNGTTEPIHSVFSQICLSMRDATGFNEQNDVSTTYIPMNGKFFPLDKSHPSAEELRRPPWLQIHTKAMGEYRGPRINSRAGWWVIEEQADHALIARISDDGSHLVAIAFRGATGLMTNSRIPCLHSGPPRIPVIPPGESRAVSGRIYLMDADLDRLMERFKTDFLGDK